MITQRAGCRTAVLIAVLLGFNTGAWAQTSADGAAVTAANSAFYTAVSALDPVAMEKVWSHEAYVNSIGPRSKTIAVGSTAVQDFIRLTSWRRLLS